LWLRIACSSRKYRAEPSKFVSFLTSTQQERLREQAARTPTPPPPAPEQPSVPLKIGSRYGLMTRQEVALIKAEEEEKSKKKGKKSARGSRSPKRSAKTREKSASPDKKEDTGIGVVLLIYRPS